MSRRVENWPTALADLIAAAENKPFVWGEHDCSTFAASVEAALTGANEASGYGNAPGNYRTALGAARKLRRLGFKSIEELVAARLEEIPTRFAQRGDVVALDTDHGPALGVVLGEVAVSPGEHGLTRYAITEAHRAWRVG